jgi:hypothetical protein
MPGEIIGYRYLKHRPTGKPAGPPVPIFKKDWPYKIPSPSQILWRYMDTWKFESMLRSSSLYFRRADKLADEGEGRLSREAVFGTSESEIAFDETYKIVRDYKQHLAAHEITRSCMFVNCWNIAGREDQRMWREYTTGPDSVVVTTSMKALQHAVTKQQIVMSRVKYISESAPRIEFSHTTPFFYKDKFFSFENELRLLRPLLEGEQVLVENEEDFGKTVTITLRGLIHRVITHKAMSKTSIAAIRSLTSQFCGRACVQPSVLL